MKATIVINEQHDLLQQQEEIIKKKFDKIEFLKIPSDGLSADEQKKIADTFENSDTDAIVFISPVPVMLAKASSIHTASMYADNHNTGRTIDYPSVYIMHNDVREKKELPNGKIVMTVAKQGWELIKV